jgi:hypothetical protein
MSESYLGRDCRSGTRGLFSEPVQSPEGESTRIPKDKVRLRLLVCFVATNTKWKFCY